MARPVERKERFADALADIDRRIDEQPDIAPWPPQPVDGELTPAEKAQIEATWEGLLGGNLRDVA